MPKAEIKFSLGHYDGFRGDSRPVGELAMLTEQWGFDGLTVGHHAPGEGPAWEPLTVLTYAAAVTKRLLLSTSVLVLPITNPSHLAQQATSLDILSGGRLILGVGVGGEAPKAFEAYGVPVSERGARANEYIEILKGLWTQPKFTYHGRFFSFEDITCEPKPVQKPHPPIWIGGRIGGVETGPDGKPRFKSKTGAIRRAARYGDGWAPTYMTVDTYRRSIEQLRSYAKEYGREDHPFTLAYNAFFLMRDTYEESLREAANLPRYGSARGPEFARRYDFLGTPQDCIRKLEEYIDLGVTHFFCRTLGGSKDLPRQMETVAKKVVPYFR